MKTSALSLVTGLATLTATLTASVLNEGSRIETTGTPGVFKFTWDGLEGRTYFVQSSDLQLANWFYWPVIEVGDGGRIEYGFTSTESRVFFRLKGSDITTDDPYAADFDGDGIPNGWEIENGLDPFKATDAAELVNGLTNLEIYQASQGIGADPATASPVGLLVYTP